jgi:lipopolysaccharide/colanic/teichoic acid biosynthesis glycosyltransferase
MLTPVRTASNDIADLPVRSDAIVTKNVSTAAATAFDPHASVGGLHQNAAEIVRPIPVVKEPVLFVKDPGLRQAPHPYAEMRPRSEKLDRAVNVAIALIGLVLAAPVMLIFAALIKLTSPGPIFYSQARVGLDRRRSGSGNPYDRRARDLGGRPFMIFKLRTMQAGAEKPNGAVWATRGDPRVTSVGRLMRKYRIDEIPQLINVIRGEMNIVGPRPERPSIFSRLCDDITEYPLRQRARPGITGWAQVNHSYDTSIDDVRLKVRYDLEYLQRQGVAEDLMIMARTVPVMIFRKGGW